MFVAQVWATDEAITNGGFESSMLKWNIYTDEFGTYDDFHIAADGAYTGSLGVHTPVGGALGCIIVQNFTTPILVESLLNFTIWVKGGVGDGTMWAGLVFNTTGWIDNLLVLGAAGSADWTQLSLDSFAGYAGEKVSAITVTAYGGDSEGEDVYFDVVSLEVVEGAGGDFVDWTGTGAYDVMIQNFASFAVPIVVMMLPVVLLMVVTRSMSKWILLIGLTIGAGLGYYFAMVPLWLVFLVVIGLIGMAYQSVRGGG